jgi:hypothetical protein
MKEHALFLELGFTPKDKTMGAEASSFRTAFESLLAEAVQLANGNVSQNALRSQQFATKYTEEAERLTSFYTGVPLDIGLTEREKKLMPSGMRYSEAGLANEVEMLDRKAYRLTASLAEFKERLLSNVLSCRTFTFNYPLLIDHILREAKFFMNALVQLVRGNDVLSPEDMINQEIFWNRIMAEHSKFVASLLDQSEENLIDTARDFGREFDDLTAMAIRASGQAAATSRVTSESIEKTKKLRDFKAAGTEGLIECKIRSIIVPLLGDHILREANHYLCVLEFNDRH